MCLIVLVPRLHGRLLYVQKHCHQRKEHNCLIVSLKGDQTFVEILDRKDRLLTRSQTKGATEIKHKDEQKNNMGIS